MKTQATIVGAGIGGLAAAVHLQARGWQVTIHERAHALPESGTALAIWPAALRALDSLGLGGQARDLGPAPSASTFMRWNGHRIGRLDLVALQRRTGDSLRLLSRPALLRLLAGALEPETIRFGSPLTSLGGVDGNGVVIAADGLNSAIRALAFGDRYRARYTGSTVWRGSADIPTEAMTETWGNGGLFGITPDDASRTNWYASAPALEGDRAADGEATALRSRFGRWHDGIRDVLDNLDSAAIIRHGLYHLDPPLPSYVTGRVALIGDAAHAMIPVLGRGACEALLDGFSLGRHLAEKPEVGLALAAYDAERRGPTQRLARAAVLAARLVAVHRLTLLRDVMLKMSLLAAPFGEAPAVPETLLQLRRPQAQGYQ